MRVLFSCLPAYGHLLPMVPLARACVAAGHEILVGTGPDMAERSERLGLPAALVGPSRREGAAALSRRTDASNRDGPMRRAWDSYTYVQYMPTAVARARWKDLRPLVARWRPDVVVHDVCDFAAPLAAATIGAASALHSWGPPMPGRTLTRAGRKAAPLWEEAGLPVPPAGGLHRGLYLDVCPPALWPDDSGEVPRRQPLRPAPMHEPEQDLPAELEDLPHERTIHLTLGTVANRSLDTFRVIVQALAERAVNLVVTVGPDHDPSVLGLTRPGLVVASYLPIDQLLTRCDLVIAHGGSGTMLAALRAGLPQLLVPYDADNVRNAMLCQDAGVAAVLPLRQLAAPSLLEALDAMLDPSYGVAARRVADEIATMPAPADVVARLEEHARVGAHREMAGSVSDTEDE